MGAESERVLLCQIEPGEERRRVAGVCLVGCAEEKVSGQGRRIVKNEGVNSQESVKQGQARERNDTTAPDVAFPGRLA